MHCNLFHKNFSSTVRKVFQFCFPFGSDRTKVFCLFICLFCCHCCFGDTWVYYVVSVYVFSHVYGHTSGSRKLKSGVILGSLSILFTEMVSLSPFPASLPDSSPGGSSISVSMGCGYRQLPFLPGFYMGPGNPHTYRAHVLSTEPSPQPMRLFCFGF